MNRHRIDIPENGQIPESVQIEIKEHLKKFVPDEVYDLWIENFVFEKISPKKIVVGYYGDASIKEFSNTYKETVWVHLCSAVGYSKKFIIKTRKNKKRAIPERTVENKEQKNEVNSSPKKRNLKTLKLLVFSAFFVAFALAIAIVTVNYIGNRNFRETFHNVSSLKADNQVRVIQISDLHNCFYGRDNQKLLNRVRKLSPDVILLTGDIIDSKKADIKSIESMCSKLSEIAPSYYVYGNNETDIVYGFPLSRDAIDAKFGFNDKTRDIKKFESLKDDLEKRIENTGVKVLKNEKDTITVGTINVDIFGVLHSNPSSFYIYAGEQFSEYISTDIDHIKITAVHEPFIFEEFTEDFWGDLIICGHTHGGTVRVPVIGPLYTHEGGFLPERNDCFVYGRYSVSGRPIIVSSGLENSNILRINNQPELVIIDVNKF